MANRERSTVGTRFGTLEVIGYDDRYVVPNDGSHREMAIVLCDCGAIRVHQESKLFRGEIAGVCSRACIIAKLKCRRAFHSTTQNVPVEYESQPDIIRVRIRRRTMRQRADARQVSWSQEKAVRMLENAERKGKATISISLLEEMIRSTPSCPKCSVAFWSNGTKSQMTLQHWNNGDIGLLCHSCNSRHRNAGDELFAMISSDNKSCYMCKKLLPLDAFNRGNQFGGRDARCRECSKEHKRKCRGKPRTVT